VSRASLHNFDELKRLDLHYGDKVIVQKAGEIIPEVVEVLYHLRDDEVKEHPVELPKKCPVCHTTLKRDEGFVAVICPNYQCPAQIKGRISLYASRGGMNIEGLGYKLISKLVDDGFVKDAGDLYALKREDLINLERFADKSTDNLLKSIGGSKDRPLYRLLVSLSIKYVGWTVARLLSDEFRTMDNLISATEDEIDSIEGVGEKIAGSVYEYFRVPENLELIERLKGAGVKMGEERGEEGKRPLEGVSFVFTGSLNELTREEAGEEVERRGGIVKSSVSAKTDYVVVGDEPGSKYEKAKSLGVKVINEDEFKRLLGI